MMQTSRHDVTPAYSESPVPATSYAVTIPHQRPVSGHFSVLPCLYPGLKTNWHFIRRWLEAGPRLMDCVGITENSRRDLWGLTWPRGLRPTQTCVGKRGSVCNLPLGWRIAEYLTTPTHNGATCIMGPREERVEHLAHFQSLSTWT